MYLSLEGPPLDKFQAVPAVSRWWGSGLLERRSGYTTCAPRENQPTEEERAKELEEIEVELQAATDACNSSI